VTDRQTDGAVVLLIMPNSLHLHEDSMIMNHPFNNKHSYDDDDGLTDRFAITISRVSVLTRDKNWNRLSKFGYKIFWRH